MSIGHFNRKKWQCASAMSRDWVVEVDPKPHICNQRPEFAYLLHNFYGATTTIKGSLHVSTPIVKRFSVENFSLVNTGPKNKVFFSEIRGFKY